MNERKVDDVRFMIPNDFDPNQPKFIYKEVDKDVVDKIVENFPWMKENFILQTQHDE